MQNGSIKRGYSLRRQLMMRFMAISLIPVVVVGMFSLWSTAYFGLQEKVATETADVHTVIQWIAHHHLLTRLDEAVGEGFEDVFLAVDALDRDANLPGVVVSAYRAPARDIIEISIGGYDNRRGVS